MKYVVELEQIRKRTVIIDANSDEEADNKLLAGDVEKEWIRIESNHAYGDWSYEYDGHYTVESSDDLITCADDLAKLYGYDNESFLEKALYKNTECGMCASWDNDKITLVGYVEGCDAEHPSETLYFPFTVKKFREVRDSLEEQAVEMWHEWNEE